MLDVFADLSKVPSLSTIHEQIESGLPDSNERWDCALENENFYQRRNEQYIERRPAEDEEDFAHRPKRTSGLLRVVVRKLAALYKRGPTRRVGASAKVDKWLQGVYADCHVNARLQTAERAAILNHVAAIQVEATKDPKRPAKLWVWKGHEFEVFCRDGDPTSPWAIAVRDLIPAGIGQIRARITVWSAAERWVYHSEPFAANQTAGGRRLTRVEADDSPCRGVLPFVFVRNEPAESSFWDGGIGTPLKLCNMDIDRELSDAAQHVYEFLNPRGYYRNVAVGMGREIDRVGTFRHLRPPPGTMDGDNAIQPDAFLVQAELGVEAAWFNIKSYADLTIEELEVPLTAVRSDAATDLSGVAIVAKTLPLLDFMRERQPQFTEAEEQLAATILAVCGSSYTGGAELLAAASDPKFECVWPEPCLPMPTPERDAQDAAELDAGLTDPIEVLARRRGITLEQAEELAVAIAKRRTRWNAIMKEHGLDEEPSGDAAGTGKSQAPPTDPTDPTDEGNDGDQVED